jgi:hypothetical protein
LAGGESQEFNCLELSVKASSDDGVKKKEGRNKAVTDLLKHQRRLARCMAKAMGHRNGHLWTECPKTRSNRFECPARKRALKKRARRAARDKQLKKSAEGRKQLRTRQRLKDQRSHPRRKALTRAAKTQLNRLAHQAKKDRAMIADRSDHSGRGRVQNQTHPGDSLDRAQQNSQSPPCT